MNMRGAYRRHTARFKLQLCQDIRSGVIGRRDAQRTYKVSANLIQHWLTQFGAGTNFGGVFRQFPHRRHGHDDLNIATKFEPPAVTRHPLTVGSRPRLLCDVRALATLQTVLFTGHRSLPNGIHAVLRDRLKAEVALVTLA
jgi:hypothetical protein